MYVGRRNADSNFLPFATTRAVKSVDAAASFLLAGKCCEGVALMGKHGAAGHLAVAGEVGRQLGLFKMENILKDLFRNQNRVPRPKKLSIYNFVSFLSILGIKTFGKHFFAKKETNHQCLEKGPRYSKKWVQRPQNVWAVPAVARQTRGPDVLHKPSFAEHPRPLAVVRVDLVHAVRVAGVQKFVPPRPKHYDRLFF
jgi:hypothetical protein